MGKVRVHELAKKLGMSNQELMNKLSARGMNVRTHSSSIDEAETMRLLGMASGDASKKPRTVLRRRRADEEGAVEGGHEAELQETPVVTVAVVHPVDEPARVDIFATPAMVEQTEVDVAVEQVQPVSEHKVETLEPAREPTPAAIVKDAPAAAIVVEVKKSAHNVVRVIDAEAIRERLRAEGRTFSRPKPPSQVREIRVVQNTFVAPQNTPDTSGPGGSKAGPRPSKNKKGKELSENEKKELKSGGYELWLTPGRKKRGIKKGSKQTQITQAAAHKRVVELTGAITVNDLAHRMSIKAGQVVSKLMSMGMMVTVNQPIDLDTAAIIANEFDFEIKNVGFEETDILKAEEDQPEALSARAPVVTVMGHVDHGKTSILDALRKANVAGGEAGGITQHIGAYSVETAHGRVTFLDTPGHEAFTSMRARGAQVTDIVVLVVAADDGVMPQTLEAIAHAKAAKVPVVVAINKMDAPNAKPDRVMQQLADHGLLSEEWGGDTQMFKVSALKGDGLDALMEGLITQAEMMELKANADKHAIGCVIEARLDKGRGPVATVLTESGTLRQGDHIVAGEFMGRVRAMYDSMGNRVEEAGPSTPVQILGLSGVPTSGDQFNAVEDDKAAKVIASHRAQRVRERELLQTSRVSLETFLQSRPDVEGHDLRLIVKADVYGSAEALVSALKALSTKQVNVDVVHSGVGTITENDVNLAMASKAIIIGFNTKPDAKANALASQEKVDVRSYSIIYEALDEVKKAMAGLLAPIFEENYLGKAEVRAVFPVIKLGKIAGCYVLDGRILRSGKIRVRRGNEIVHTGAIGSLKRFKDDVREVATGYECGISLDNFADIREGDIMECFELKQVAAKLDESIVSLAKAQKADQGNVTGASA